MLTRKEAIRRINQVGENFGWQVDKVPVNYCNGYMQAVRDCKVPFYGLEKPEENPLLEIIEKLKEELDDCRNYSDINEDYYLGMWQGFKYAIEIAEKVGGING